MPADARLLTMRKRVNRATRRWGAIGTATLVLVFSALPVHVADAQERYYYRRSILDFFLGRRYIQEYPRQAPSQNAPQRQPAPKRKAAPKAAAAPRPAAPVVVEEKVVEKLANAQKILVVGDFLAGGLGVGMDAAFKDSPGIVIETHSNVASGLVRDDYYDWPQQLTKFMDEAKPAMVIVMLGANDRQQMVTDVGKEKFRTDGWYVEYQRRVVDFGKQVTGRKIPLLWVGLPAFDSPAMTADAVQLNQLFRKQMESVGGEFVDIWDGFVSEGGEFIVTGSDINGQQVRLRTSDGINLTEAGRRKLAFYVEKPVRRILGIQASPDLVRLDTGNAPTIDTLTTPGRTEPISLSDPNLDGGAELLGGRALPVSVTKSPRDMLVQDGEMAPPPAGRVDDYRMAPMKPAEQVSIK
ncbi:SGNH/GDSL hydrolase family protein [Rhizobium sp. LjRoot258]|uniref:SGNH/GDSL hydrolase family protein n=1 Tax=Rhizobium sp. LjRoot258 TaxID=3342299 RepID=UPI003ED034D1